MYPEASITPKIPSQAVLRSRRPLEKLFSKEQLTCEVRQADYPWEILDSEAQSFLGGFIEIEKARLKANEMNVTLVVIAPYTYSAHFSVEFHLCVFARTDIRQILVMRLINTHTYALEEHLNPGSYAILSHTWREGEEVLFGEYSVEQKPYKSGYRKIRYSCKQARRHDLNYLWVDSCCIDKSSSAELSEAINSMYAWYKNASVCYVYVDDVKCVSDIENCRWISRGWTLQELIAPREVYFYDADWKYLGTKSSLLSKLVFWTNIDQAVLENGDLIRSFSAAARMSWAGSRRTTRIEDMAYCLLGIFGVNMPLIYGEGNKAFTRLQEEVLEQTGDLSLLAFDRRRGSYKLLASCPDVFLQHPKVVVDDRSFCQVTSAGLLLDTRLVRQDSRLFHAVLDCRFEFDHLGQIALPVVKEWQPNREEASFHIRDTALTIIPVESLQQTSPQKILLTGGLDLNDTDNWLEAPWRYVYRFEVDELTAHGYELIYTAPEIGLRSWSVKKLCSEICRDARNREPIMQKFTFVHRLHHEAFTVHSVIVEEKGPSVHLAFKSKPESIDCKTWLEAEDVHSVLQVPGIKWWQPMTMDAPVNLTTDDGFMTSIRFGYYEPWPRTHACGTLHLKSKGCFASVVVLFKQQGNRKFTIRMMPKDHSNILSSAE